MGKALPQNFNRSNQVPIHSEDGNPICEEQRPNGCKSIPLNQKVFSLTERCNYEKASAMEVQTKDQAGNIEDK